MAYELIETVEVGSGGAASIEFTSIPQDGTDLVLVYSGRNSSSTSTAARVELNGTSTNYSRVVLEGDGSTVSSGSFTNPAILYHSPNSSTANTFGNGQIYISNYTSTSDISMSVDSVYEDNATTAGQRIEASTYTGGSAVTSISLTFFGNTIAEHTTASLYKITAA